MLRDTRDVIVLSVLLVAIGIPSDPAAWKMVVRFHWQTDDSGGHDNVII